MNYAYLLAITALFLAGASPSALAEPARQSEPCPFNAEIPYFQDLGWRAFNAKEYHDLIKQFSHLRFLTSLDKEPFNFVNQEGYVMGYNIDLMRALCQELGLVDNCSLEAVPFDKLAPTLLKGGGDFIIADLRPSAATAQLAFSAPYLKFPGRFVTKRRHSFCHFADDKMRGKKVAVFKDSAAYKLLANYFTNLELVIYQSYQEMFGALEGGEVWAIFANGFILSQYLNSRGKTCCSFAGQAYNLDDFAMRIAYDKERTDLGFIINYALKNLEKRGVFQELYMRYFPLGFY